MYRELIKTYILEGKGKTINGDTEDFWLAEIAASEERVRGEAEVEFGVKLDKNVVTLLEENRDELQRQKEIVRKKTTREVKAMLRPEINRLLLIKGVDGKDLVRRDDVLALLHPQGSEEEGSKNIK